MKRPAANVEHSPAKKAKAASSKKPGLTFKMPTLAPSIPESLKTMLELMLPFALDTPKEKRHPFQQNRVDNVVMLLEAERERLKTHIEDMEKVLNSSDAESKTLEEAVTAAQEEVQVAQEAEKKQRNYLAEQAKLFKAAKSELESAAKGKESYEKDAKSANDKLESLKKAKTELIEPLVAGAMDESNRPGAIRDLTKLFQACDLDKSMLEALPAALSKDPESRGEFDAMVIDEINKQLAVSLAHHQEFVDGVSKKNETIEAAIAKAEVLFVDKKAKQNEAANDYMALQTKREAKEHVLSEAKMNVASFGPTLRKRHKAVDDAKRQLDKFEVVMFNFTKIADGPKEEKNDEKAMVLPAEEVHTGMDAQDSAVPELPNGEQESATIPPAEAQTQDSTVPDGEPTLATVEPTLAPVEAA